MLPVHFGPRQTVYGRFRQSERRFLFQINHDLALVVDRDRPGARGQPFGGGDRKPVRQGCCLCRPRQLNLTDEAAHHYLVIEIICQSGGKRGLQALHRRWVAERFFGWMTRLRGQHQ